MVEPGSSPPHQRRSEYRCRAELGLWVPVPAASQRTPGTNCWNTETCLLPRCLHAVFMSGLSGSTAYAPAVAAGDVPQQVFIRTGIQKMAPLVVWGMIGTILHSTDPIPLAINLNPFAENQLIAVSGHPRKHLLGYSWLRSTVHRAPAFNLIAGSTGPQRYGRMVLIAVVHPARQDCLLRMIRLPNFLISIIFSSFVSYLQDCESGLLYAG